MRLSVSDQRHAVGGDVLPLVAVTQHRPDTGERRMLRSMLLRARDDAQAPCVCKGHRPFCPHCRAWGWVLHQTEEPFGFPWTCEMLGLDAQAVRAELKRSYVIYTKGHAAAG